MQSILLLLCSIALVAALEGARQLRRSQVEKREEELRRRLQSLRTEEPGESTSLLRRRKLADEERLNALLETVPAARALERLLEQADSRLTVAGLLFWSVFAAGLGGFGAGILQLGLAVSLLLGAIGLSTPWLLLVLARRRRSNRLSEQLPEALDMMSRSLRAGHAFISAFEVVATEMPEPVAVEFGRAFESQRLGIPVEQAIVQMTERVPGNRDLKIFAVSAVVQKETGGNMAEILGNIAETVRARYRFYGKLRALTAEGRASALVLGALPFGITLLLKIVNPGYLDPLFLTPAGHSILLFALGIWAVGLLWLVSLMRVDI